MPKEELDFIKKVIKRLSSSFRFKCFEILGGNGIIVYGENKR